MAEDYFNPHLTEEIPEGALGNQAYFGIFYKNARGRYQRLTEAEGHEVSNNPETEERNTIGMKQPKTVVKSYKEQFSKDITIEKKSDNYEHFKMFDIKGYTGKNAILDVLMVDMNDSAPGTVAPHLKYRAYECPYTVTVDSRNYSDSRLAVSFGQAGDKTPGVAEIIDDTKFPVFIPASDISVASLAVSEDDFALEPGEEAWAAVSFAPFGCPEDFSVESSDPDVCVAERIRESARIRAVGTGSATVTVASSANPAKTESIAVLVA